MAAPFGNLFGIGNDGGRPPEFETPEQMAEKIQEFINNPPTRQTVKDGEVVEIPCITITGLALFLGFESRQSFYDYEKKEAFTYIIKKARLFVEQGYESNLHAGNCTGSIFALKNMGWKDKSEVEHSEKVVDTGSDEF